MTIKRKTVSQCLTSDYCRGWNDAVEETRKDMDRIVEQLEAEKYRGMEGLEPIKIAFNFGINKALDLLKGVQNE